MSDERAAADAAIKGHCSGAAPFGGYGPSSAPVHPWTVILSAIRDAPMISRVTLDIETEFVMTASAPAGVLRLDNHLHPTDYVFVMAAGQANQRKMRFLQ